MCIISFKHKFVFIRTQKTGSSSLGCNFGEFADGEHDIVVPMRPLPQLDGRPTSTYLPRNYKQLIPWVCRFGSGRAINHTPANDAKAMLGDEQWENFLTISSVRDPFEAMLSEYFYIQDFITHPLSYHLFCLLFTDLVMMTCPNLLLRNWLMRPVAFMYRVLRFVDDLLFPLYSLTLFPLIDRFGAVGMGETITFKRSWISSCHDDRLTSQRKFGSWVSHLFSQYADLRSDFYHPNLQRMILDDRGEVVKLDHYIRFESMQSDFNGVCLALGFAPQPVAWLKNGGFTRGRKRVHYSYYYNDSSRSLIQSENSAIIEKFGYHFIDKYSSSSSSSS